MNKVIVKAADETLVIEAPDGKNMVFDASLLAHGILSLGEYGPSGVKIAAFKEWEHAWFFPEGYKITKGV